MILGAHNAWSYSKPRTWIGRLFSFVARCQSKDIHSQYEDWNTRCFDLRVRFDDSTGEMMIVHGGMRYDISEKDVLSDLAWLDNIARSKQEDIYIRVLLDTRTKRAYTEYQVQHFKTMCKCLETMYASLKFWCGKNLYDWNTDYEFKWNPSCEEKYSSVCPPKYIDDWCPWLYAHFHNHDNIEQGTDKDILLIDFVNIQ